MSPSGPERHLPQCSDSVAIGGRADTASASARSRIAMRPRTRSARSRSCWRRRPTDRHASRTDKPVARTADFSGPSGRRALRQNRHSISRSHGSIRWCGRDDGAVETICGALIILGRFTRLASIPLIVIMIVAIVSTKIPILLGHDLWIFHLPKISRYGFWSIAHEARADFCMLLGLQYPLIEGGGRWSVDALLSEKGQGRE